MNIEIRKSAHIDTVLGADVSAKGVDPGFDRFFFDHVALPETSISEVDLSKCLFKKTLSAPILISSMTGGTEKAKQINLNLAMAAEACGVAMGLGSQRAALEDKSLIDTYRVRSVAPNILLFANFGAVQLNYGFGIEQALHAVEMIEADALFLHLNPLQEAVQLEGDGNWKGLYKKIEDLVEALAVPVVVKEVGNGISVDVARRLVYCGVAGIDVAGAGGTSWSEVEAFRQTDPIRKKIAHCFAGWGIPTALCLAEVKSAFPDLMVFASGGLRSGLDMAKAIRLGADLCGIATPALQNAIGSGNDVEKTVERLLEELRISAFCVGARGLEELKEAKLRRHSDWSEVKHIPFSAGESI
ncbi:MAG: type 2 isopentenyl-diphosphate Delta-isomerase [Pseudomonadota bacterium]|nr:type 2 isopentenyl-diphosphate Delta-isomerase [Pseudomonadota bacterium]